MTEKHNHYFRSVEGLKQIDVYRIIELFDITCPASQHILKKAMAAGKRGAKDKSRDMQDIIDTATRWQKMREEDAEVELAKSASAAINIASLSSGQISGGFLPTQWIGQK